MAELCVDCGRNIRRSETACIHGEVVVCLHCDLKRRLGCPDLNFCTRCHALINKNQQPWLIDGLVACEACACRAGAAASPKSSPPESPTTTAPAVQTQAEPTEEETQDAWRTALMLSAAWLNKTEEMQPADTAPQQGTGA